MSVFDIARTPVCIARTTHSHLALLSTPRRHIPWSDGFYQPPSALEKLGPGQLIRAEPMHAYLMPGVRVRARAWRILYRSTGAVGEPTAVSGTLLLPQSPRRQRALPLIAYAIGTHGIGDEAAPSRLLSTGRDWEAGLMALVLARGYAVVVTDYQGLGTPGDHVYMVGRPLGCNVLDGMRAARDLVPDELLQDGPAAIMGYSEGGTAAAWAAQLQPTYAPELTLAGVAAGAAAADVELAGPTLDGSFFSFFLAYGAIGFAAAYPELELEPYLTPASSKTIEALRHTNVLQAAVRGPRFAHVGDLSSPNVLELPPWRKRLRENRLGAIAPQAPMLLHHARNDQIVAFEQSEQLLEDWLELGVDASLHITRGGVDHLSGAVAGAPFALEWISQRLAGGTLPGAAANVVPLRVSRAA
ncbi:MAG TPA: lipase family protein [Solirubrobacteraceae bacterium]|jgi:pimeloyl-ACP methyl ester carboxylesterase|nr:lipase family protein [Solirubrobacteraceae bacterium]